jgi:hypothetical protein
LAAALFAMKVAHAITHAFSLLLCILTTTADVNFGLVELEASLADQAAATEESEEDSDDSSSDSGSDGSDTDNNDDDHTSSAAAVDVVQQDSLTLATSTATANKTAIANIVDVADKQADEQSISSLDTVTQSLGALHVDISVVDSSGSTERAQTQSQSVQLLDDASVSTGLLSQLGPLSTADTASSVATAQHRSKPLIQEL